MERRQYPQIFWSEIDLPDYTANTVTAGLTNRVTKKEVIVIIPFLIISVSILLAVSREIRLWYELLTRK